MWRYDSKYRETVRLGDGTVATLRAVTPEDRRLLAAGFEALSPQSRYYRFFSAKQQLTTKDLDYLTQVDGRRHFALGAVAKDPEVPLGIARFVLDPRGHEAEAAVVVVDAHQGQGLGRMLLERLGEAAFERGVRRLRLTTIAENQALPRLVRQTFYKVRAGPIEDGTRTFTVDLLRGAEHPLTHLRRTAAQIAEARLRMLESMRRVPSK